MKRTILIAAMLACLPATVSAAPDHAPNPAKCVAPSDPQITGMAHEMLRDMDANHDAQLSRPELTNFAAAHHGAVFIDAKRWKQVDTNHDGRLSLAEIEGTFRVITRMQCTSRR